MSDPGSAPRLTGSSFSASLKRFLAEAQVDEASSSRERQRWLEQQLAEDSHFLGTLTNLAESQVAVGLALVSTDILRCTVHIVGSDFVVALDDFGHEHVVAISAINRVETESARTGLGERRTPSAVTFSDALAVLAEERPDVAVHHFDGSGTRGELIGATKDEVRLRVRERQFRAVALRLGSVSRVSIGT